MVIDELHVRVLDGAERQLTHGRVHDLFPAWSPDRSQAFVRDGSLHVMRADGTMTATHNRRKPGGGRAKASRRRCGRRPWPMTPPP
jgi:hypothetical protein